jgi:hypothetical protein
MSEHQRDISGAIGKMPKVATIATLASRLETFRKVLPVIHAQVDHVYVYLDGYSVPPDFLERFDRVTIRQAELHASSRFLCLEELSAPTVVIIVDDDIVYPQDYVHRLVNVLQGFDGHAIVGVHGRLFIPPHRSYIKNAATFHFTEGLAPGGHVHELGIGTCAFLSSVFNVNPREWDRHDMDDIVVATEAQRRGLPRIAVARAAGWLMAQTEPQSDSLWAKAVIDDSEHSRRMRALLSLYACA